MFRAFFCCCRNSGGLMKFFAWFGMWTMKWLGAGAFGNRRLWCNEIDAWNSLNLQSHPFIKALRVSRPTRRNLMLLSIDGLCLSRPVIVFDLDNELNAEIKKNRSEGLTRAFLACQNNPRAAYLVQEIKPQTCPKRIPLVRSCSK